MNTQFWVFLGGVVVYSFGTIYLVILLIFFFSFLNIICVIDKILSIVNLNMLNVQFDRCYKYIHRVAL